MAKNQWISQLSDLIIPVGALFLGYSLVNRIFPIKAPGATSTAVTGACPRGQTYTRGYFGDCDPNYIAAGSLFNDTCNCLTGPSAPAAPTVAPPTTPLSPSGTTTAAPTAAPPTIASIIGGITGTIGSAIGSFFPVGEGVAYSGSNAGSPVAPVLGPFNNPASGGLTPVAPVLGPFNNPASGGLTPAAPGGTIFLPGSGGSNALEAIKAGLGV